MTTAHYFVKIHLNQVSKYSASVPSVSFFFSKSRKPPNALAPDIQSVEKVQLLLGFFTYMRYNINKVYLLKMHFKSNEEVGK